ncbi:MAG: diaminopimelate decarboxylase, partial [Lachnospiraceae bacterium]
MKRPFVSLEQIEEIVKQYPTPFHIYDEKGIRENAKMLKQAFSWNKGFREYFAVKAEPNPIIMKIFKEEGFGVDCSSFTELKLSAACGFQGHDIMFSSNVTPEKDYKLAYDMGAIINLDDFSDIDRLNTLTGIPQTICLRYNPGGKFSLNNAIMDTPGEAKYGMTREQLSLGVKKLMQMGAKHFGLHSFLASNTIQNEYYPVLAKILFETAVELNRETGAHFAFINLSGGVGIPYRPEQKPTDILLVGEGVRKAYEEVLVPAKMDDIAIFTELGRFMTGPYGHLITTVVHEKKIYKDYIGVDACAANL